MRYLVYLMFEKVRYSKYLTRHSARATPKMAGAHKSVWIFYGGFQVVLLEILQKGMLKRR